MPIRPTVRVAVFTLLIATISAHAQQTADPNGGLWVGKVSLNQVTDATEAGTPVTPTSAAFEFTLILFVDDSGKARILKEVIVMRDDAGDIVLVTDPAAIANYSGVVRRGGKLVGLRYASAAFDFGAAGNPATGFSFDVADDFGAGQNLEGTFVLAADHPTNPYRHKFHPDHREGIAVTRKFEMTVESVQLDGDSGRASGTYRETLTGLRKESIPIVVGGAFVLNRLTVATTLD